MEKKYDVFISYSRKDYVDDEKNIIPGNPISEIHRVFDDNGISYWFDKEGVYSSSEFIAEIGKAIKQSKLLLFVSSQNSNSSKWTAGEILKAVRLEKNIIPFLIDNSPYGEKFDIALLPIDHIDYTENPKLALENLIRSVNIIKEKIAEKDRIEAEKREKQKELARRQATKNEILQTVSDYQRIERQQEETRQQMVGKMLSIEEGTKKCPVCHKDQQLAALFCDRCGFPFPPLYGIDPLLKIDALQLSLLRSVWKAAADDSRWKKRIEELKAEKKRLETEKTELEERVKKINDELLRLQQTTARQLDAKDGRIKGLEKENDILQGNITNQKAAFEKTKRQLEADLNIAKKKLEQVSNDLKACKLRESDTKCKLEEEARKRKTSENELETEKKKRRVAEERVLTETKLKTDLEKKHKIEEEALWKEIETLTEQLDNYKKIEKQKAEETKTTTLEDTEKPFDNLYLSAGTLLNNRYKVGVVISQGPFGISYRAYDQMSKCDVVIKEFCIKEFHTRIGAKLSDGGVERVEAHKRMFMREASLLKSTNTPHVTRIYEVFEQNNTAYYVRENIEGTTLLDECQKDTLSQKEIVEILKQVSNSLLWMHLHNIIHGDICPQNIIVTRKVTELRASIIDFGLPVIVKENARANDGKIGYRVGFSPSEICSRKTKYKENDCYAFGALIFFSITGQIPPQTSENNLEAKTQFRNKLAEYGTYPKLVDIIERAMGPRTSHRLSISKIHATLNNVCGSYWHSDVTEEQLFSKERTLKFQCPNCRSTLTAKVKNGDLSKLMCTCPVCKRRDKLMNFDMM